MNPDFPNRLAAQLRDNPSFLEEMDDILLSELVCHYYEGELDAEDAAEVASMLETNPKAKAIYQRIEAADRFATSPAGKTWLESLRNRVMPSTAVTSKPNPAHGTGGHASRKIMRFPSILVQLMAPIEAQLAASVPEASPIELDRYSIEGTGLNLRLMTDRDGHNVEVRVFTKEGSPSAELDGARFTWKDGISVVVQQGQAVIPRPSLIADFTFTAADGTAFDLTPLQ